MALEDIRGTLPSQVTSLLLDGEKVYFYGTGSGCLGGSGSYIVVTDSRVLGAAVEDAGGCLGCMSIFGGPQAKRLVSVAIPLEHVSSVETAGGGCLIGSPSVDVSSGTASNSFSTQNADHASRIIQEAMRDVKGQRK